MSSPAERKRPTVYTFRWKTSLAELKAHPSMKMGTRSGANLQSQAFDFMDQQWRLHLNQLNRFEGTLSGVGYPRGPVEPPNLCLELLDYPPKFTFTVSIECSLTLRDKPIKTRKFDLVFNRGLSWITLGNSKLWPWRGSSGYELWTLDDNVSFDNISCSMTEIKSDSPPRKLSVNSPLTLQNKRSRTTEKVDDVIDITGATEYHKVQIKVGKIIKIDPSSPTNGKMNVMSPRVSTTAALSSPLNEKINTMSPRVSTTAALYTPDNQKENPARQQIMRTRVSTILEPVTANEKMGVVSPPVSTTDDSHINSSLEEHNVVVETPQVKIEPPEEENAFSEKSSSVMKAMFFKKDFSDIILLGPSGHQYHAHKVVLSAWSPILHSMCLLGGEIMVPDLTDKAIEGLLEFLYCESVSNLENIASELYVVANRYDLEKLKTQCLKSMSTTNLTVENAPDILIFADKHNMKDLKMRTMHYINQHAAQVKKTAGFRKLLESHLKLIAELYSCLISQE
ncbi:hypothetical protein QAD02_023107 [Eretmocerus hayati]|uniref:Uncharacterized protein n=1 Tax=Eretmocerus hayati TaxID=131215 RepID=A0ACC2PWI6_9HYME|nr:hypothetical protein QAD02_023107 [Eretmocerus hayati]